MPLARSAASIIARPCTCSFPSPACCPKPAATLRSDLALPQPRALLARAQPGRQRRRRRTIAVAAARAGAGRRRWAGRPATACLPCAARSRGADGIATGERACGLLTPAHWHLGTERRDDARPRRARARRGGRRARCSTRCGRCSTSEGFDAAWGSAAALVRGARRAWPSWPTASLDRVIGRNVDRWLADDRRVGACCGACRARRRCCCTRTRSTTRREARELVARQLVLAERLRRASARAPRRRHPLIDDNACARPAARRRLGGVGRGLAARSTPGRSPRLLRPARRRATLTLAGERRTRPFDAAARARSGSACAARRGGVRGGAPRAGRRCERTP